MTCPRCGGELVDGVGGRVCSPCGTVLPPTSAVARELGEQSRLIDAPVRDLARAVAATPPSAAPDARAAEVRPQLPLPPLEPPDIIYTTADQDVTPPLSVLQRVPQWRPTSQEASQDYKGVLRLIIDRSGAVESVSMPTGTRPAYDQTLMRAAREWKFQPAQRQGRPVKYLKVIEIHLAPGTSGTQ